MMKPKLAALPSMAPLPRLPRAKRQISIGEATLAAHFKTAGIEVEREFAFDAARNWRFDFAIPSRRVGVEVEGGAWSGGRHTRGAGFAADCRKYNAAAALEWFVFRFTTEQVIGGEAIRFLAGVIGNGGK